MMMFLRCVGEAVAARGLRALAGLVPLGEQLRLSEVLTLRCNLSNC
jgi:hypothetical protein